MSASGRVSSQDGLSFISDKVCPSGIHVIGKQCNKLTATLPVESKYDIVLYKYATHEEDHSCKRPYAQALSPVGRCRTFDAAGDGYGRGEGFVMMLCYPPSKPAVKAVQPLAVICSSAINQACLSFS